MLNQKPHPRLVLMGALCVAALIAPGRWAAGNDGMTVLGKVKPVPAMDLILKPAGFFDLEGKTVTFTPDGAGGYAVQTGSLTWVETSAATGRVIKLREPAVEPPGPFEDGFRPSWKRSFATKDTDTGISLPFVFPFAGRTWTRVHANRNGNLSFAAPETTHWEQRDPWADGTMRSFAAAVDSRSATGFEAMIAVLWAIYGEAAVSVDSSPARVAITWNAARPTPRSVYYEPAGPNVFQVRLYPSGVIEFAYRRVSERDGIVGLFHGTGARGGVLSAAEDDSGDVPNATVDIVSAALVDNGSTVIASVTMADDIPDRAASGSINYRFNLDFDGSTDACTVQLSVGASGRRRARTWGGCGDGASPKRVGYTVQGPTLEIPISKILIPEDRAVQWRVSAIWWGPDETEVDRLYGQPVILGDSDHDLSSMTETVTGNLFEVFHYPSMPKEIRGVMSYIYERLPDDDELAVVLTDFRVDDLFNTGAATGPINASIEGIGRDNPQSGSRYRSDSLLSAVQPVFIGAPKWAESGEYYDREFHGHSYGVSFIAHELVHRWAAHLRFRNPRSQRIEDLTGDGCACHWSEWLHAPARHPVSDGYSDQPYPEASVMGGRVWQDNGDGTFTLQGKGWPLATGLSDLDLYVMGMIPPEEVKPTFLLRDVVETGTRGLVRATKVPVRIEDIVAVMGPRVPAASEQRRVFRLGVYLLHEDGRAPRAEWLERAQNVTRQVVKYFDLATGGRARETHGVKNAASLAPGVAPGSMASLFGENMVPETISAGVRIEIIDATEAAHTARLLYVSPEQINFLMPADVATGEALLRLAREGEEPSEWAFTISAVAPGLFSANGTGEGIGVVSALRVAADGLRSNPAVFRYDAAAKRMIGVPLDLGAEGDQVFLTLFGTGIRGAEGVRTTIGGRDVAVLFAGERDGWVGVDQVEIGPLPRSLAGMGEVDVAISAAGITSNTVTIVVE